MKSCFWLTFGGGTPFNQANSLISGHEDKWAIVTGVNLPMLIEVYDARMSMDKAHEIAAHVLGEARDGVKVRPEALEPTKAETEVSVSAPKGAIPRGRSWETERSNMYWRVLIRVCFMGRLRQHGQRLFHRHASLSYLTR